MATSFDSFNRSPLGDFVQSSLLWRGDNDQRIIAGTGGDNVGNFPFGSVFGSRIAARNANTWAYPATNLSSLFAVKTLARFSPSVMTQWRETSVTVSLPWFSISTV